MDEHVLTQEKIERFREYLILEEKSAATVEKYIRDVRAFSVFMGNLNVTKEGMMNYKKELVDRKYAICSINSMLASLNSMLDFLGWSECKVKHIKQQRITYCTEEKELTKGSICVFCMRQTTAHSFILYWKRFAVQGYEYQNCGFLL